MSLLIWLLASAWADCEERPAVAEPMGAEASEEGCAAVAIRMSGRAFATLPSVGTSRGVSMPDGRAALQLGAPGDVSGRLAVIPLQSGGPAGYIGVSGESWVPAVQLAEARWDWKPAGLALAAGIVDEPWVSHELRVWGYRPIAPGAAQENGVVARADVGGWVAWTAPDGWVSTTLAVHGGEGFQRRERNNGVNLTGMVVVRPLEGQDTLEAALFAREGSRGLLQAHDHRAGVSLSGGPAQAVFGASAVLGWGYQGDGSLSPTVASAFARTAGLPVAAWLRADHFRTVRSDGNTGTTLARFGGGPRLPFTDSGRPAYLVGGADLRLPASGAGSTAGQPTALTTLYVQLTADLGGRWALESR